MLFMMEVFCHNICLLFVRNLCAVVECEQALSGALYDLLIIDIWSASNDIR